MSDAVAAERATMSARAYGAHRGVSGQAVLAAIKAGRISDAAEKDGKRWVIDVELADRLWDARTDPTPRGNQDLQGDGSGASRETADGDDDQVGDRPPEGMEWREWWLEQRARREKFQADLARIKRDEEDGRLVDGEAQRREGFEVARLVRDAVLMVADRLAPELTAEMDEARLHDRLRRELIDALRHLCEEVGGVEIQRGGSG